MNPTKHLFVALTLLIVNRVGALPQNPCGTCELGQTCCSFRGVSRLIASISIYSDGLGSERDGLSELLCVPESGLGVIL